LLDNGSFMQDVNGAGQRAVTFGDDFSAIAEKKLNGSLISVNELVSVRGCSGAEQRNTASRLCTAAMRAAAYNRLASHQEQAASSSLIEHS
jgi:hypothetical protein